MAAFTLISALLVYEELLVRLRRFETAASGAGAGGDGAGGPPWWFGYARDGVNLVGTMSLIGGFLLAGFGGPRSLVLGAVLALVAYALDAICGKWLALRGARVLVVGAAGALAVAAVVSAAPLAEAMAELLALARPR